MTLQEKINLTRDRISEALSEAHQPVVLFSGGKDSTLLLHFCRQIYPRIPVLCFVEPLGEHKADFINRVISEWELEAYTYAPSRMDVLAKDDQLEIINVYDLSGEAMFYLPTGIEREFNPDSFECGLNLINKPLISGFEYPWDVTFIGHRGEDVDPIHGPLGARELKAELGPTTLIYPLQDWTTKEIWEATIQEGVPWNEKRYDQANGFKEFPDLTYNNDYHSVCVRCLDPSVEGERVICPLGNEPVPHIGRGLDWTGRRAAWRETFVNIAT